MADASHTIDCYLVNGGYECTCWWRRKPQRTLCLHTVGFWPFRRACGSLVDAVTGECPVHGLVEEMRP